MDRLHGMRIFVDVVNSGSFSAAADKIGLSRAQVSKSVMQLERYLGTRLLNRTTRSISLTEPGRIYFERSSELLDEINEIETVVANKSGETRGRLTLSAPTSFGIFQLQDAIPAYLERYPEVQISLSLADRFIDVVAEGFDLVIRIAELEDSSLVARRLAPCKRILCATPSYLEKHGTPQVPQDLAIHHCLVYSNELKPDTWRLQGPDGNEDVKVNGPFCADNGDILRAAAVAGLGVTLLPTFIVGTDLRSGKLRQILPEFCPPEISVHAVFPSRRWLSPKVRSFVDFLTEYFGDHPEWDACVDSDDVIHG